MGKLQEIKKHTVRAVLPNWEHVGEDYYATITAFPMSYSVGRSIITFCKENQLNPNDSRILVVGAYGGRDYYWLTGFGYKVDLLDLGDYEWAQSKYVGDACLAETWKRIDRTYDLIVMHDILEHLPEDFAALRHARTVLKRDGFLFLSVPFKHDPEITHVRSYSKVTLDRLLSLAGFKTVWRRDRPGLLEAFPRFMNLLNYGLALLMPTPSIGASVLHFLLRTEYVINERTRRFYRIVGRSPQKGISLAAKPVPSSALQDYVENNKEMFVGRLTSRSGIENSGLTV